MPYTFLTLDSGKAFGLSSMLIHLKSCEKKWETQESQKSTKQRRSLPSRPPGFDEILSKGKPTQQELDAYNEAAFHIYNNTALTPCPNCKRTFLPDRLEVHLKSCKGGTFQEEKKGLATKPRGIICYICGKEYGTASIEIHLKTCKKRWEDEEAKKPQKERRPLPKAPKDFDLIKTKGSGMKQKEMDALNEEAFHKFNEESRVPCLNCGRKFLPDRLEVHLRSCGKSKTGGILSPQPKSKGEDEVKSHTMTSVKKVTSPPKIVQRPKALICYICGKEYGTHSLEIHLKSCKKKWEEQEATKPLRERKPVPEPPKVLEDIAIKGRPNAKQMELYNAEAFKDWKDTALDPCPNCGRKFLPDRLVVHLRSCKTPVQKDESKAEMSKYLMPSAKIRHQGPIANEPKEKPKKKPESIAALIRAAREGAPKKSNEPMIVSKGPKAETSAFTKKKALGLEQAAIDRKACPNCGRKFALDRIDVHYNICTKQKGGLSVTGVKPAFKAVYN